MGKSVERIEYVAPQGFRYVRSYDVAWYVAVYFRVVIRKTNFLNLQRGYIGVDDVAELLAFFLRGGESFVIHGFSYGFDAR